MEEETAFTHSTTIGGKAASLTVQGARGVWVTSVKGLNDTEANRRFINLEIADQCEANRLARCEVASSNLVTESKIETDKRTPIAKAGFELLLNGVMPYAFEIRGDQERQELIELTTLEAATLFRALAKALTLDGVNVTEVKQLYSLAQCGGAEKQFMRGYQGMTVADVCEAWYLLRPWINALDEIKVGSVIYEPKNPLG